MRIRKKTISGTLQSQETEKDTECGQASDWDQGVKMISRMQFGVYFYLASDTSWIDAKIATPENE